jgi:hypothetical protein
MRTVRTLEAEWRQVLQRSIGTGKKEVLGAFGLLDFTML